MDDIGISKISGTGDVEVEIYINGKNEIYIQVGMSAYMHVWKLKDHPFLCIVLWNSNIDTASQGDGIPQMPARSV